MEFDIDAYWRASGPHIASESRSPEHLLVDSILRELLPTLGVVERVLDVGCGRGRIARLLTQSLPKAEYHGLDIGDAQIEAVRALRPDGTFYLTRLQDFRTDLIFDLVTASEVLMHIPPHEIEGVTQRMQTWAPTIVTVDWTETISERWAPWNWLYDYPALFGAPEQAIRVGLQTIFVFRR